MKKVFLFLFIIAAVAGSSTYAQIIFSNGTGGGVWSSPGTWSGGVVPGIGNDVIILAGDSVLISGGAESNNLTVSSGAIAATSADEVTVAGALTLEGGSVFYNQMAEHSTLPGSLYIIDETSTVVHVGSGGVGGEGNLEFGNLIIQRTAGSTAGGDLIIHGDLTLRMDAHNRYFRVVDDESGSQTLTVEGDIIIERGTLSAVDVGAPDVTGIINVHGDIRVMGSGAQAPGTGITAYDARIGPFSSASAVGTGIINVDGDFIIDGGRLHGGTSSTNGTGTGIFNLNGNLTITANSNVSTTHAGPIALNFTGNGTQTVTLGVPFSMSTNVYDTVAAGSNVVFNLGDSTWRSTTGGDFVVNGSLELVGNSTISGADNFMLNPGATLKIGAETGISAAEALGNIQNTGSRSFSAEANYEYNGGDSQVPGDGLPASVNGLAVNNSTSLILFGNYTVNNSLNIINGSLDLNNNTVTLSENAMLTENAGNVVMGQGAITITKDISVPVSVNVGGLGAEISSSANMGLTTVTRTHTAAFANNNVGILRQYNIQPANNTDLNAMLRFYYDDSELNGLNEENLVAAKSEDGSDWAKIGGTVSISENYVDVSGIESFSFWTLTDEAAPITDVETTEAGIPEQFALHQNYPNPFNPATTIKFELPQAAHVNLSVFNIIGQRVATLINEQMDAGYYKENFNAVNLPSGVYIYKLSAGEAEFTHKMILMK